MDVVKATIKTYDRIASDYCKKTRQPETLRWEKNHITKLLSFISAPNPHVLDVGCGDGRHCRIIEEYTARTVGIDLSHGMLNEARTHYPDGTFCAMDMRSLGLKDNSFHAIWSSGSIYHVPKFQVSAIIEEFGRVLKPDGVVALNFKLGTGEKLEENPKSYEGSPRYFAYYSKEYIVNLFTRHGFLELESCLFPRKIFGDRIQQVWFRAKK